jgi:hypothetical protein
MTPASIACTGGHSEAGAGFAHLVRCAMDTHKIGRLSGESSSVMRKMTCAFAASQQRPRVTEQMIDQAEKKRA